MVPVSLPPALRPTRRRNSSNTGMAMFEGRGDEIPPYGVPTCDAISRLRVPTLSDAFTSARTCLSKGFFAKKNRTRSKADFP